MWCFSLDRRTDSVGDRATAAALVGFILAGAAVAAIASFARSVLLREERTATPLDSARLELDAAHVSAGIVEWHWDLESGRLQISQGAEAVLGVSPASHLSKTDLAIV